MDVDLFTCIGNVIYHHEEISLISRRTELEAPPQPEDFLYPSIIIWSPFEEHNLESIVKCPLSKQLDYT